LSFTTAKSLEKKEGRNEGKEINHFAEVQKSWESLGGREKIDCVKSAGESVDGGKACLH